MNNYTPRFIEIFDNLEAEHGVREWQCQGIHIWPLIKFLLARHLDEYVKDKKLLHLHHDFSLSNKLAYASRVALDTVANFANTERRPDVCLLTYETFRHYRTAGRWFNAFQDPLVHFCNLLGLRLATLEVLNFYPPRRPHLHASQSVTLQIAMATLLSRSPLFRRKLSKDISSLMSEIDRCSAFLGLQELEKFKNNVAKVVWALFAIADAFERQLRVKRPKLALLSNYYSVSGLAYCLACHRLGIRSADISHGASGQYHYAYGGWRAAPPGGYELLPKDFLTRTESDAAALGTLLKGITSPRSPIVIGDLAAHAWFDNASGVANGPRKTLQDISSRVGTRLEVLIAANIEPLPPSYLDVMERAKSWCFFWVRFHPTYMAATKQFAMPSSGENFEVQQATNQPLYSLLERVKVVITETSSVAEDAHVWKIPSIITHDYGQLIYRDHIDAGRMFSGKNANEIVAELQYIRTRTHAVRAPMGSEPEKRERLIKYLTGLR